jgi:hypothetical protein
MRPNPLMPTFVAMYILQCLMSVWNIVRTVDGSRVSG